MHPNISTQIAKIEVTKTATQLLGNCATSQTGSGARQLNMLRVGYPRD
jgi:hypothetical protein